MLNALMDLIKVDYHQVARYIHGLKEEIQDQIDLEPLGGINKVINYHVIKNLETFEGKG